MKPWGRGRTRQRTPIGSRLVLTDSGRRPPRPSPRPLKKLVFLPPTVYFKSQFQERNLFNKRHLSPLFPGRQHAVGPAVTEGDSIGHSPGPRLRGALPLRPHPTLQAAHQSEPLESNVTDLHPPKKKQGRATPHTAHGREGPGTAVGTSSAWLSTERSAESSPGPSRPSRRPPGRLGAATHLSAQRQRERWQTHVKRRVPPRSPFPLVCPAMPTLSL